MNEFGVIFRHQTAWRQLLTEITMSLQLCWKFTHGLVGGTKCE